MVLSTFPTTLFDFPDHVISYSLTSLLLMFGFTAKENWVKVNKISEVCLHWTGFWGTNVSLHLCLWSFFFLLSKVSYWCIVGSFGMDRMQKGISESLLHNWKLHQKADGRGFSQLWMEHIWTFCSEQAELQMNAECGAASHLWRAEDPLNLPQRDLVALMILNLVLKIFPFLLLLVLLLSTSPPPPPPCFSTRA